jgi:asparagine synthase (glutamine-hydrolysing)
MIFLPASRPSLYAPEYYAQVRDHDPRERKLSLFRATEHLDTAARMQHADAHLYLTDDILVKVDKASMLNSLETRTPMLDQKLVAYVSSLPSTVRTRNGTLKYLLKRVAADMLPEDILTRPKRWFRADWADYARDILDSPRAQQRGIFQPGYVRNLLQTHARSRVAGFDRQIWALLCLELWFQVYMDPSRPAVEQAVRAQASGLR